jgi:CBS domain-containing protein
MEEVDILKIKDIMNENPIIISPDFSVGHTLNIFNNNHVRSLPVVNNNEIVGEINVKDIYTKSLSRQEKISSIMSENPLTISPDEELVNAVELLKKTNKFEIIVARYNKFVGILSVKDIIKKLKANK